MKKLYEELSVDLVKFEAQDVITVSAVDTPNDPAEGNVPEQVPNETEQVPNETEQVPNETEPEGLPDKDPNVDAEL